MNAYLKYLRPSADLRKELSSQGQRSEVSVSLVSYQPISFVRPEYASYSIDISVLAGGFWWEGSDGTRRGLGTLRVPPLDLRSKKLDRLVKALGPAYLRVGGSEADHIHYFQCQESDPEALVLTKKRWDHLHEFIQRNNLKFSFTFKYGLFKRHLHGDWSGSEIQALLDYSLKKGYRLDVCELGNELNAYWAFHGLQAQPGPRKLAQDYDTFSTLIRDHYPDALIAGPGSAYWPRLGETIKPFTNLSQNFLRAMRSKLDIVDWHFYPFQSDRSPVRTRSANLRSAMSARSLNSFKSYSEQLRKWRDIYHPRAELWTGETGSAQCGGQPKLSDRFASSFWWADQLGQGARLGQKVMIRQSLIGGDYGLIDRLTLKPRPDYWITWLWKSLMGEEVFDVASDHDKLRVYCHRDRRCNGWVVLLINLGDFRLMPNFQSLGQVRERYIVTAKDLQSKKVRINGKTAKVKKSGFSLEDFPQLPEHPYVPARSISFWCMD
jgi:heparanase 1